MLDLLFLVFALPLAGFVTLAFARGRLPEIPAAFVGVGSVAGAFLVYLLCAYEFLTHPPEGGAYTQVMWQWMHVGNLDIRLALRFDGLSLAMVGVITGVGTFIHLFASWYMRGDEAYDRFLSYMNLFVASMLPSCHPKGDGSGLPAPFHLTVGVAKWTQSLQPRIILADVMIDGTSC